MSSGRRQVPFIDTYSKVAFGKFYDCKTPLTVAALLNYRVKTFLKEHGIPLCRMLTDRSAACCGLPDRHEYGHQRAVEDIDHTNDAEKPSVVSVKVWKSSGIISPCVSPC